MGKKQYQFGTGGRKGPEELETAIAAVRELGALLLEVRELSGRSRQSSSDQMRIASLVDKCEALEGKLRQEDIPLIDGSFSDSLRGVLQRHREQQMAKVDKEGILKLANLVANWRSGRREEQDQRVRASGISNRPVEVVSSVPLSVVPRIQTLEAALRISEKVKRQLLLNEHVAAMAQTANLASSSLRLLDPAHRIDWD